MIERDDLDVAPGVMARPASKPDAHGPALRAEPRVCRAGEGAAWWSQGWALFKPHWDVLCAIVVLQWLINAAAGLLPVLGNLATALLGPTLSAGLLLAFRMAEGGGKPEVGMLFAGFSSPRLGSLVVLGVASLVGLLAVILAVALPALGLLGAGVALDGSTDEATLATSVFALMAVLAVVLFVYLASFLFALPLVLFHDVPVVEAMKLSLRATTGNWASLTVYGLIGLAWSLATVITFFLGLIVVAPVMLAAYYWSYRAIFTEGAPLRA